MESTALVTIPTKREARLEAARRTAEDFADVMSQNDELLVENKNLHEDNTKLVTENNRLRSEETVWKVERDNYLRYYARVQTQLTNAGMAIEDAKQGIAHTFIGEPLVPNDFVLQAETLLTAMVEGRSQ